MSVGQPRTKVGFLIGIILLFALFLILPRVTNDQGRGNEKQLSSAQSAETSQAATESAEADSETTQGQTPDEKESESLKKAGFKMVTAPATDEDLSGEGSEGGLESASETSDKGTSAASEGGSSWSALVGGDETDTSAGATSSGETNVATGTGYGTGTEINETPQGETPDKVVNEIRLDEPKKTTTAGDSEVAVGTVGPTLGAGGAGPETANNAPTGFEQKAKTYVVQKGDSLWRIAQKYYGDGKKFTLILRANKDKIKNGKRLPEGLTLTIPPDTASGSAQPASTREKTSAPSGYRAYKVKKGDSLWRIAKQELGDEGRWTEIINSEKRPVSKTEVIVPGQTLYLPTRASSAAKGSNFVASTDVYGYRGSFTSGGKAVLQTNTPATSAAAEPVITPSSYKIYHVKKGDTLEKIARKELGSGGKWREILKVNKGLDPKKLQIGMKIKIPQH